MNNPNESGLGKNYWIAMTLSMIILMGYPLILKKINPPATQEIDAPEQSDLIKPETAENSARPTPEAISNPEPQISIQETEAPTIITYENDFYNVLLSTSGGSVSKLVYIGEKELSRVPEMLFFEAAQGEPGIFGVKLLYEQSDLSRMPFKLTRSDAAAGIFEFTYEKSGDYKITKKFEFKRSEPVILLDVNIINLSSSPRNIPAQLDYEFHYELDAPQSARSIEAVALLDKLVDAHYNKVKKKGFLATGNIQWAGLIKKHYGILIRPYWTLVSAEASVSGDNLKGSLKTEPAALAPSEEVTKQFVIYAGPQRYEYLKHYGVGFEQVLSRGFFGVFKIWLLLALKFFNNYTHNFGVAILLLTLILKGLFTPFTHASFETMKKMQALQPKIKSIQERFKKDPEKMNREMMELYRRNKVNPMLGCLPMLAQIPVFIAFYQMLNDAIELKGAPFLFWIHDLAEPDKLFMLPFTVPFLGNSLHLLPLLYVASTVWQQKLTPQTSTSPEQAKIMAIYMPVVFGFIFYNMPSGLVLYAFMNNALSIIHQTVVKRMVVVLHHEDRD